MSPQQPPHSGFGPDGQVHRKTCSSLRAAVGFIPAKYSSMQFLHLIFFIPNLFNRICAPLSEKPSLNSVLLSKIIAQKRKCYFFIYVK